MPAILQVGDLQRLTPRYESLRLEHAEAHTPDEAALETPLFDFALTQHQMGARVVWIPPHRAFATHIHPNAYHFIQILSGTALLEYDSLAYTLHPHEYCLVCKGMVHKLGAGEEGLLALIVTSPGYENGDPSHITYIEEETLPSFEVKE